MAFKSVSYSKGDVVIEQGKMPADFFYVRESGDVRVIKDGEDLGIFKEQSFGELALLYDAPRAATIECATDCDLWALDRVRAHTIHSRFKRNQFFSLQTKLKSSSPFLSRSRSKRSSCSLYGRRGRVT